MTILMGLGNPGRQYSDTKHNFGFWVVDRFAEKNSLEFQAGKGDYLVAKSGNLACVKPTTYMNSSGMAVAAILGLILDNCIKGSNQERGITSESPVA